MKARCAALALLLAAAATASPGLRLEGGPFRPYRINRAAVVDDEGLLGRLELWGLRWDGARVLLFRAPVAARTRSLDADFYLDEDIRNLEVVVDEPGAGRSATFEAAAPGTPDPAEAALRLRMRGLEAPLLIVQHGDGPAAFDFRGSDVVTAAFQASSALFTLPVDRAPLLLLGAFALVALAASASRRREARALVILAALGTTAAVFSLAAPRAVLFSLVFPDGKVPGTVRRTVREAPGCTRIAYVDAEGSGGLELVALRAPAGTGIPVDDVVPPGGQVRFSSPPTITGERLMTSEAFTTGWVLHAGR
ncbi:MAG TPA: hypothetical protein PKM35_07955 [Holophaga sp.]|nr:hypothetical protein [Holophaga sp.]HPS68215.1 hypothetical protein [Holophaga sp.]